MGSERLADPPKCLEGPLRHDFFFIFCDLPAVKLFRRGPESWKMLTKRVHNNIQLPERAPTGAVRPLAKGNCCEIGPFNAYLPDCAPTEAIKTGPSRGGATGGSGGQLTPPGAIRALFQPACRTDCRRTEYRLNDHLSFLRSGKGSFRHGMGLLRPGMGPLRTGMGPLRHGIGPFRPGKGLFRPWMGCG